MRSLLTATTFYFLAACAPTATSTPMTPDPAPALPGFMVEVEGIEIWMDMIPTTPYSTIARSVALPVDEEGRVFPADRLAAIATVVRQRGGSAAIVRTTEREAPNPPFAKYTYEVDVIR